MMKISVLTIVLVCFPLAKTDEVARIKKFGECKTLKDEIGECIYLEDCKHFYDLLRSSSLRDEDKSLLKQSHCGFNEGRILICCPEKLEVTSKQTGISGRRLLPQPGNCGNVLSNRIFGGNVTKIDEFPWMALLEFTDEKGVKRYFCGGSLINNRYVVTAAHCLNIPELMELTAVRLGEWDITTEIDCEIDARGDKDCAPPHVTIPVEKIILHPQFKPTAAIQSNDIALLRLGQSVTYTDFIRPICLPLNPNLQRLNLNGIVMDISGWGVTEQGRESTLKLKADVPVTNLEECRSAYKDVKIDETQLCAGGKEGKDSCRGDSGGPLIGLDTTNRVRVYYYLAGIVSFGSRKCGSGQLPGVYTKVSHFVDWIEQTIEP